MSYHRKTRKTYSSEGPIYSVCGELIVRGYAKQVAERYDWLAEKALKTGDDMLAQLYLNYAEHYRKVER